MCNVQSRQLDFNSDLWEIIALGEADVEPGLPNASAAFGLAYHLETYPTGTSVDCESWKFHRRVNVWRSQVSNFVLSCHYSLTCFVLLIHFLVARFERCLSLLPSNFPPFFLHLHLAQPWPLRQNHFIRGMKRRFASITNFFTRRKCLTLSPWTQTIRRVRTSIRCTTKVGRIRMLRFSCPQYRISVSTFQFSSFAHHPLNPVTRFGPAMSAYYFQFLEV